MNRDRHLARCYLHAGVGVHTHPADSHDGRCVNQRFALLVWSKYRCSKSFRRGLQEEPNRAFALGKHVRDSSSQAFLWNSGKNDRVIFGEERDVFIFFPPNSGFSLWTAASAGVMPFAAHLRPTSQHQVVFSRPFVWRRPALPRVVPAFNFNWFQFPLMLMAYSNGTSWHHWMQLSNICLEND